jgi:hypothetical protein
MLFAGIRIRPCLGRTAAVASLLFALALLIAFGGGRGGSTPSPAGAAVYFVDLKDGATLDA